MDKLQESLANELEQFLFKRIDQIPFTKQLQESQDKQIQLLNCLESHIKAFEQTEKTQEILDMLIAYSHLEAEMVAMESKLCYQQGFLDGLALSRMLG